MKKSAHLVLGHFPEHLLHALLELAAVFGAGHHGVDVEFDQALVAQRLGTSPATIRCASPSTMAVLPTPGSPISTGLFFLRRASTSMVVSISCARPMTGSSLPSRAILVRSREAPMSSSACWSASRRGHPRPFADHLADLLAQRLRREAVTAQQVGHQTFAFLGEPDQEMLRPDIRMAEFVGGHESTAERVLDPATRRSRPRTAYRRAWLPDSIWRLRSSTLILNCPRMVLTTSLSDQRSSRCSVSTGAPGTLRVFGRPPAIGPRTVR